MMRRRGVAAAAVAAMLAGGLAARAQLTPACVADRASASIGARRATWMPGPGMYWYSWPWTIAWTCGLGLVPTCHACSRVELERWTGEANPWVNAGVINTPSWGDGVCGKAAWMSATTTVWGLRPNTFYRVVMLVATWNPADSGDCFGQEYVEVDGDKWVTLPNP